MRMSMLSALVLMACAINMHAVAGRVLQQQPANTTLTLSSNTFTGNGQQVTVTWSTPVAQAKDYIAVYLAPVSTTFNTMYPLKYKLTGGAPTGSVTFTLQNFRDDYQFAYIQAPGNVSSNVISVSPVMTNTKPNEPSNVHLAPGSLNNIVSVQWVTKNAPTPKVRWGTMNTNLPNVVDAKTTTYKKSDLMAAAGWGATFNISNLPANASMTAVLKGWMDPGSIHSATIAGLDYLKTYYYQVYDDQSGVASPVYSFTTPPNVWSTADTVIMYTADNGVVDDDGSLRDVSHNAKGVGALGVVKSMASVGAASGAHLAVVTGDISYSDGILPDWEIYNNMASGFLTAMPTITVPGNHERDYWYNSTINSGDAIQGSSYGGESGIPYETLYQMPRTNHTSQVWSTDIGPIHWIQIDTELDMSNGGYQWNWVTTDLSKVDRRVTPYVIVSQHRPIYCPVADTDKDCVFGAKLQANGWDTLFFQNNVTMVLSGHVHVYARTCPVTNNNCIGSSNLDGSFVPQAPVYAITGFGGPVSYGDIVPKPWFPVTNSQSSPNGFMRFTVNRKRMLVETFPVSYQNPVGPFTVGKAIDTMIFPNPMFKNPPQVAGK